MLLKFKAGTDAVGQLWFISLFWPFKPMSSGAVETWEEFDLILSIRASFSLPLFQEVGRSSIRKLYGYKRGLELEHRVGTLVYRGCLPSEALLLSGAWFNPFEGIKKLRRRQAAYIYVLLEVFPGLGLAIDPWDMRAMFYSIFLSRNTDYHANTVRWVREMALRAKDEAGLASLDPREFGSSFQLAQLSEIKPKLDGVLSSVKPGLGILGSEGAFRELKAKLLSLPYVGPKTVHALGLFCFGLTQLAPADRHLLSISRALGVVEEDVKVPRKALCSQYDCARGPVPCPMARECITSLLMRRLGLMAGWFQTAAFLYGSLYLSRGLDPAKIMRR